MTAQTADYTPEKIFPSTLPPHYREERRAIDPCSEISTTEKGLERAIVNTVGAAAFQRSGQTFFRRWVGQDTLTWGNVENWILTRIVQELFISQCVGSPTLETDPAFLESLSLLQKVSEVMDLYSLQIQPDIWRFLQKHPQVVNVLVEAYPYLMMSFGSVPRLNLKVVKDPETNGEEELMAYLLISLPIEEAMRNLDHFDETWFLDQLDRTDGLFNFNLQFEE